MSDRIDVANVKIDKIFQTEISDANADKLCLWMQDILLPWSILRTLDKQKGIERAPLTLDDFNALKKICLANGGLAKLDANNSNAGFVLSHEMCAAAVGLLGYKKEYVTWPKNKDGTFDVSQAVNLLSWGALVELRHDGHHSLTATGWYKDAGKFYFEVRDPWPYTNDERFDCARGFTQRYVSGAWADSRPIESFAWFYKIGSNPKWIL